MLAAPETLPAVFHCTAGKDRTGCCPHLLSLLGVDEHTVVADYALSGDAMERLRGQIVRSTPRARRCSRQLDEVFSAAPAQDAERCWPTCASTTARSTPTSRGSAPGPTGGGTAGALLEPAGPEL